MHNQLLLRILKEPLLHFLVIGLILFGILNSIEKDKAKLAANHIEVSKEALTRYLEFRAKIIQPEAFAEKLDRLSKDELQALIDNFVREEVLFREARTLGLDKDDFGARQRLIQQLEFINQGIVSSIIQLSENDLRTFLEFNQARYIEPTRITFTHVFFNTQQEGSEKAFEKAQELLSKLNATPPVPFEKAPAFGDRFLFHQNYVGKDSAEIKSHFGAEMQMQLFDLNPNETEWRGPFNSNYGSHLVLLTKKDEDSLPAFEDLKTRLEEDAFQYRMEEELRKIEKTVVDNYSIQLDDELEERLLK
ncbi:MAG: peptidylprolyl isomerase [Verrucomicrobia bacterium]|nr:peptidylprolyl isomerase [Verrucomicrobiota bacterium]MDA1068757.1 peptidylprolyl isomerase [Verrucomicrobiota bacterium]